MYGSERKMHGVTWCQVRYSGQGETWLPWPAQIRGGELEPIRTRGCDLKAWPMNLSGFGFGNAKAHVRARCGMRRGVGWYLSAVLTGKRYVSQPIPYDEPISILSVYRFSPRALPVILAQVGFGMTGQPYELFTFRGNRIVPLRMRFIGTDSVSGALLGGGAAFHGQGVFCSRRGQELVITQLNWDGPTPNAPSHRVKGGGREFNARDKVVADYERWTFAGQPLTQRSVRLLPAKRLTYRVANALENAHCP